MIEPTSGWHLVDIKELWDYRDLFFFLTWRNIRVRYAQSALGVAWAVIQPLFMMIVFTVVFGYLVSVDSQGTPYAIFSYIALVPWTFYANTLTDTTDSLVKDQNLLTKIYFPRLLMPMAAICAKLVDFAIAFTLVLVLLVWYGITPTVWALALPIFVVLLILASGGAGLWLTAMAIQYRDIKYAVPFTAQGLMYLAPVVYPSSLVPDSFRLLYALNPMVGVIEGFRAAFLGTTSMPWDLLAVGAASSLVIATSGLLYFRRTERVFADVA